ncbi:unnamed protein product [Rotaria sordida]|uniref:K Homology domain-containing protein n=1 Tax=Rotaria sordida TaxID=392033 RepID=A0A818YXJ2_9BILA|nr:unnamed protein product [Rotaria sordida]CAF1312305.1 unnamed protein product [Rotaria sordida]CAF3663817.1 unnamed protein product [Rotaria sordida]CAF3761793.1 unnamed protein product [Rotaria sordida]
MACLVHHSRYRCLFHAVVNELRNEKRIPVPILRNMAHQCCTCSNLDNQTLISVVIDDKDKLTNLQKLIDQIHQDKKDNPKFILSLNRLENFIKENRVSDSNLLSTSTIDNEINKPHNSLSKSQENLTIDTGIPIFLKINKPPKPFKNGKFLFLPYKFEIKPSIHVPLEAIKQSQRGRFIGRKGYITSLEEQYNVCISMITPKTTAQVIKTLENAKAGKGSVTIHNRIDLSEGEDGEWILVRPKKSEKQVNTIDFAALLDELINRWKSSAIKYEHKKEVENEESQNKK